MGESRNEFSKLRTCAKREISATEYRRALEVLERSVPYVVSAAIVKSLVYEVDKHMTQLFLEYNDERCNYHNDKNRSCSAGFLIIACKASGYHANDKSNRTDDHRCSGKSEVNGGNSQRSDNKIYNALITALRIHST